MNLLIVVLPSAQTELGLEVVMGVKTVGGKLTGTNHMCGHCRLPHTRREQQVAPGRRQQLPALVLKILQWAFAAYCPCCWW